MATVASGKPQTNYPLIPLNIPGAYTSPAPPDGFDPNTAMPSDLVKQGLLWRRPEEGDHPSLRAAWEKTFSRRWLEERKLDLALPALVRSGILHVYPVLSDIPGSLVSQAEHTVIVTGDGCIVTTR